MSSTSTKVQQKLIWPRVKDKDGSRLAKSSSPVEASHCALVAVSSADLAQPRTLSRNRKTPAHGGSPLYTRPSLRKT